MITRRDALRQLTQQGLPQQLLQLGLTDEHHLQQLGLIGFQVGQQAQLLQHLGAEMLRLIDQQQGLAPGLTIGQ